jgi:nitrite reductase/ring-hydroxylating ferredoxin subunit
MCDVPENPLPRRAVNLKLDLMNEDRALKTIPSFKEYTLQNINPQIGERIGFGGVLVVHTVGDEYVAFDRACPYEVNSSVTVAVDADCLNAVCPKCGTKYDLNLVPGAPNGKSQHYLLRYTVVQNGNYLVIKN